MLQIVCLIACLKKNGAQRRLKTRLDPEGQESPDRQQRKNEKTSDRDIIRIFPSKVKNSKSVLVLKKVKTSESKREIYITPNLLKEFRYRQQQVAKNKVYYGEECHDYGLVFCLDNGDPIEPKLCEKWFLKW